MTVMYRLKAGDSVFDVIREVSVVGRRSLDGSIVPDVDLTALDRGRSVSRRHASLTQACGDIFLSDLDSMNGTWLNGRRLEPGQRVRLSPGDRIEVGQVELFCLGDADQTRAIVRGPGKVAAKAVKPAESQRLTALFVSMLLFPNCEIVRARSDFHAGAQQLFEEAIRSGRTILVVPWLREDTYSIFATEARVSEAAGAIHLLGLRRVRILHTDTESRPPTCDAVALMDLGLTVTPNLIDRFRSAFGEWLQQHSEGRWAEGAVSGDDPVIAANVACQALFNEDVQRASLLGVDDVGSRLLHCLQYLQEVGPQATGRKTSQPALPVYSNVGDRDREKAQLRDAMELALQAPEAARGLRIRKGGILLCGPRGAGKAYLATATAGEFGCRLLVVEGQRAIPPAAIDGLLKEAARAKPCVVLIEGLDVIDPQDWLGAVDWLNNADGLVLVATATSLAAVDPALIASGRFDSRVMVSRLDESARRQVLEVHLRGRADLQTLDLGSVAIKTNGRSAPYLEGVVNLAAISAFKAGRGAIEQADLEHALQIAARNKSAEPSGKTWADLVLPEATMRELRVLQSLIEDPRRGQALGVTMPRGAVLFGPPGTGKTTIAKVLAEQTGCSFFPVSIADILDKWVGVAEQRVHRLFDEAREHPPSVIFIDELEALAGKRTDRSEGGRFMGILLNQILIEVDGFESSEGVFVIGATNRIDMLDPAITRGGRLSEHIEIGLPDRVGRIRLIRLYAGKLRLDSDVDFDRLADLTDGCSGGDMESICQRAARYALGRNAERVGWQDFEASLPPAPPPAQSIGFQVAGAR